MARGQGRTRFVRPPKRSMIWLSNGLAQTVILAGTATLLASLNAGALALRPFTIVRTRLILSILSDQTGADEFVQGAFGMQTVSEAASAAGVAAVPTPLAEPDADFFVYQPFAENFLFVSGVGVNEITGQGSTYTIDSKAMRKVDIDDDVVITVENRLFGYAVAVEGRQLIKLH